MKKWIRVNLVDDMDAPFSVIGNKELGLGIKLQENDKLPNGVSIGQQMVDDFIKEIHVSTIGNKTTMVRAVLVNDFEIIETSACVSEANYDEEIGKEVCLKKIKDKVWFLLGFLLQCAVCDVSDYVEKQLQDEDKMKETIDMLIEELPEFLKYMLK